MRAFIAVEMSKEIKEYLYDLQLRFRKELKDCKVNWVAKRNLHLTMKFLGEIDEKQLEEIKKRLGKIKIAELEVKLDKVGFFPNEDYIRVIFVGLQPEERIIALQQKIDMELLELFGKEQEFHGHVTLGRVKFVQDKKKMRGVLKREIEQKKMMIEGFQLMRSELGKDGAKYFLINSYNKNLK